MVYQVSGASIIIGRQFCEWKVRAAWSVFVGDQKRLDTEWLCSIERVGAGGGDAVNPPFPPPQKKERKKGRKKKDMSSLSLRVDVTPTSSVLITSYC